MTKIASVATHMISVPRPEPVWTAQEGEPGVVGDPDRGQDR